MSNLTATGTSAAINLLAGTAPATGDYRLRRGSGLEVQRFTSGSPSGTWANRIALTTSEMRISLPVVIEKRLPTLTFLGTPTPGRIRADGERLAVETDIGGVFSAAFETDGARVWATRGVMAGEVVSASPSFPTASAIAWRSYEGTLGTTSPKDVSLPGFSRRVVAALVRVRSTATGDIFDCVANRKSPTGNGFMVRILRNTPTDDVLRIDFNTATYGDWTWKAMVFFQAT